MYFSLFLTFFKFGCLAWGGPIAQIAMIRHELVDRQRWITGEKFNRALAVYQALPGPEAHEMCVYMGMLRGGRIGGALAGLGFMVPGFLLMLALSHAYVVFGPAVLLPWFIGIKPAVVALVIRALFRIGEHALHNKVLLAIAALSALLTATGMNFLMALVVSGVAYPLWNTRKCAAVALAAAALAWTSWSVASSMLASNSPHAIPLFIEGLKAGLLTFGGAYTAIPFLEDSLVSAHGPVTLPVFLDGLALSSVIPAPLVIFGTFLGYVTQGVGGALSITAGIFLPAFGFTLLGHRYLEKLIEHRPLHGFLDGVTAGVIGLFAVTAVQIASHTLNDIASTALCLAALLALFLLQARWLPPLLIFTSGIVGYFLLS